MRLKLIGSLNLIGALLLSGAAYGAAPDQIIVKGVTHQKIASATCENKTKAIKWKEVYWCPLSSYKTAQVDYKHPSKVVAKPAAPVAPIKPPVEQIIVKGVTHQKIASATCENTTKAIKWKEVYWCPLSSYKTAQVDYKQPGKVVAKPATPAAPSKPPVDQIIVNGVTHQKIVSATCENTTKAIKWKEVYWCPLNSYNTAQVDYKQSGGSTDNSGGGAPVTQPPSGSGGNGGAQPPVTAPAQVYTAQLNWSRPSKREDGTHLTTEDLKGYEIYYTSDDLKKSFTIPISGGASNRYLVSNLTAGVWHFTISAVDKQGLKSQLTPVLVGSFGG